MRQTDAEQRLDARNRRVGEFLQVVTEGRGAKGVPEGVVTAVNIRLPTRDEPEALLIVKAEGPTGKWIAFVGGLDVVQAVLMWATKDRRTGLKWREDVPWDAR
jgi:hypothetical protein